MRFMNRSVVMPIVIINVIMFFLQILIGESFTNAFLLLSAEAFQRPWILVTSMFLHGGVAHLIFNMYVLLMFGPIIEQRIGPKRFLFIYFTAGIMASIVSTFFYPAALGASGAIFGILGCLAILRPKMRVYVGYVPMPMIIAAVVWAAGDLLGMFIPSGTANAAHLFGY